LFRDLTRDQSAWWIQLTHPEKMLGALPGAGEALSTSFLARVFGVDVDMCTAIRSGFRQNVDKTARDLLADPALADAVDRLPFAPGSTVVAFGDSITDDYQSWAEILRRLLELRRPHDCIRVVNAGVSGDTTTTAMARLVDVEREKPSHVICMLGTNDARVHRQVPTKCLVSIEETQRNLAALRDFARARTSAGWTWITPPPTIEHLIQSHWYLSHYEMMWRNADLGAIADSVRSQSDPVVDLWPVFGHPAQPGLLLADGLHPSLAGQRATAVALVRKLAMDESEAG